MAAVKLSTNVIRAFVDSFDTILVDCDGMFQQLHTFKKFVETTLQIDINVFNNYSILQEFSGLVAS